MSKRSTRSSAEGYSILEMLIAMAVGMAVGAGALSLAMTSRRIYEADQSRTHLNQSLRASKEFLLADIRQAGERLTAGFPAIEIRRGEDLPGGLAGDSDELYLRRNLIDTVLWLCEDVATTDNRITIADKSDPALGCAPLPPGDGDTLPFNLQRWSDYRVAQGGDATAYIYDPVAERGEFFTFRGEDEDPNGFYITKGLTSGNFTNVYFAANQCRIYILEERRYALDGDVLQMVVNGDDVDPVHLVDSIEDFQLRALLKPTPEDPTPAPLESFDGIDWPALRSVGVTIDGRVDARKKTLRQGWSSEIMPRNVL